MIGLGAQDDLALARDFVAKTGIRSFSMVWDASLSYRRAMRWITVAACIIGLAWVGLRVVPKLGFEFLPYMDEGVIWVRANFPEGTSLIQTSTFARRFREPGRPAIPGS